MTTDASGTASATTPATTQPCALERRRASGAGVDASVSRARCSSSRASRNCSSLSEPSANCSSNSARRARCTVTLSWPAASALAGAARRSNGGSTKSKASINIPAAIHQNRIVIGKLTMVGVRRVNARCRTTRHFASVCDAPDCSGLYGCRQLHAPLARRSLPVLAHPRAADCSAFAHALSCMAQGNCRVCKRSVA